MRRAGSAVDRILRAKGNPKNAERHILSVIVHPVNCHREAIEIAGELLLGSTRLAQCGYIHDDPTDTAGLYNTSVSAVPLLESPTFMLSLASTSSMRWLQQVDTHLEEILIDHAHCEKKAAGTALNLIFAYVDRTLLCRELAEIVTEELEHFRLVLDLLERRGIRFRRLPPGGYGRKLNELVRK
jgi:hypothetical protein